MTKRAEENMKILKFSKILFLSEIEKFQENQNMDVEWYGKFLK